MCHRFLVDLALKLVLVPIGVAAPRSTTDRVGRVERLFRVPRPVLEQPAAKLFLAPTAGRGRADRSDLRSGVELLVRERVELGFGATPRRGTVIVPSEQVVVVVSEPTTLGAVQAVLAGTAFDFVLVDIVVPRREGVPLRPAAAAERLVALRFRAAAVPGLGPDRVVVSTTDTL